jgi:glutathione S-transferase
VKLYIHPFSSNCAKVTMTAALVGASPDIRIVDLARGEQKSASFLDINPNGKVPALVDGDFELWESNAIMVYLAAKGGARGRELSPDDPRERADVERWMCWGLTEWSPAVFPFPWENVFKPMLGQGAPDAVALDAALAPFEKAATILDRALSKRSYLVGDRITLADITLACPLMYQPEAKIPLERYASIGRWLSRIQACPAWAAAAPKRAEAPPEI